MGEELKPCPWCGSTSVVVDDTTIMPDEITEYFASCTYCGAQSGNDHDTKESAIAAWNTLATLRAERDAAVKALQAMLDCMVTEATMDGSTHQAGPSVRRGHPWAQAVAKARKALGVSDE